jgi:hypothetical protein
MAKKRTDKLADNVEALRPYVERALKDESVRKNLREAVAAAQNIYGDLSKGNGVAKSASKLAGDKDVQLSEASDRVKGKKESHKMRNTALLAGIIAGALYNPWTGPQTRKWLTDKIAGSDDLEPLESWETTIESSDTAETVGASVGAGEAES